MASEGFDTAKKNKADEFYTQIEDIEKELKHYEKYFEGKIVFCNCDDPFESNFFRYFALNFNYLKLKKLIATCYDGSPIAGEQLTPPKQSNNKKDIFDFKKAYKIEITEVEDCNGDGAIDLIDIKTLLKNKNNIMTLLNGNGDFRSSECIKLLDEADIIVTNPPFSLFREYVSLLVEHNKSYIIMGNTNALTYKEIFALFKEDKIRTGYTNFNVGMYFFVPDYCQKYHKIKDGRKMVRVSTSCWFTNMPVSKHNDFLICYKNYDENFYPKYCNYNAINIDRYTEIPSDYNGEMGVPITFLDKFNPKQFEIIALGIVGSINFSSERKMEILDKNGNGTGKYTINAKGTLYRMYNPNKDKKAPAFKDCITGDLYSSIYARVIIRRKENEN